MSDNLSNAVLNAMGGVAIALCVSQAALAADIGASAGIGGVGVSAGIGFGGSTGGTSTGGSTSGGTGVSGSVGVGIGDVSASADVGVGNSSTGGTGIGVDVGVSIGGTTGSPGTSPGDPSAPGSSTPPNSASALAGPNSGANSNITVQSLVGTVVMSSDRQVLGIVQSASQVSSGYMLRVQLNDALGFEHENMNLRMGNVKPRNGRVLLRTSVWQIRQQLG